MKIAVTGGAGFIGKAVARAAGRDGHELWASVDTESGGNICNSRDMAARLDGAEAVIHLAGVLGTAELFDNIGAAIEVNIRGSVNVMQWCVDNGARYVGILMPDVFPSIYTASKIATKRFADALHHSRGLQVSHVRAFNAYGPGQKYGAGHPQKILPTFAVHAWHRKPLPVWGSGHQTVDMIHVDDLGRMLVDATRWVDNEMFDGGTGTALSVREVAQTVAEATGWSEPEIEWLPMRDGERETAIVATGEGWDKLGWRPMHHREFVLEAIAEAAHTYEGVPL